LHSNNATEAAVPPTLVSNAEFVWNRTKEGYTQQEIAEKMMGCSRERVKDYAALQKIDTRAWDVIGATCSKVAPDSENGTAPSNGATAPFTEGLLRSILSLTPEQQLELVSSLARGEIQKNKFKKVAEDYQARNEMYDYAKKQLGDLGEPYRTQE